MGGSMKRRELIVKLVCSTAWWPLAVRAQQSRKLLSPNLRLGLVDSSAVNAAHNALIERLSELGFVDGANLSIDYDNSLFEQAFMDAAYADMVKRGVDILLASGSERHLSSAVRAAAGRIPIVFLAMDYDPLRSGHVASLARPGGNVTGLFVRQPELAVKRLEMARHALPRARRVALLWDGNIAKEQYDASSAAAASLGFDLQSVEVGSVSYNLPDAVERTARAGVDAVVLASSFLYYESRAGVAQAALELRLPLIAFAREFVEVGALMSYGVSIPGTWRRAADYVARIARGTNPGDLPIEQPTLFELVVNGRTASSLGLNLPPTLLGRADDVIE